MTYNLIPAFQQVHKLSGSISSTQSIKLRTASLIETDLVTSMLHEYTNFVVFDQAELTLQFKQSNTLNLQAYELHINKSLIEIVAHDAAGFYYGVVSLSILASIHPVLECMIIKDEPTFYHRAVMLDVARHFIPKQLLIKLMKLFSILKFNVLHLHLSDDQGWRVAIQGYEPLTDIGSLRNDYLINQPKAKPFLQHSGFYNETDVKELVENAKRYHIKIIPEIDIPGHTRALLAAYPSFSCHQQPIAVSNRTGIHQDVLCVSNPVVKQNIKEILLKVCALFETNMIHIGGDEVPIIQWAHCPSCVDYAKKKGFNSYSQLQTDFTNEIITFLKQHHIQAILWNDNIHDQSIDQTSIIQHWQYPTKHSFASIAPTLNNPIIESTMKAYYFDYPEAFVDVKKVYEYQSLLQPLPKEQWIGIECALWTETISDYPELIDRLFPRVIAVAEKAWTNPTLHNYQDFKQRLQVMVAFLNRIEPMIRMSKPRQWFVRIKHISRMLNWETVKTVWKNNQLKKKTI